MLETELSLLMRLHVVLHCNLCALVAGPLANTCLADSTLRTCAYLVLSSGQLQTLTSTQAAAAGCHACLTYSDWSAAHHDDVSDVPAGMVSMSHEVCDFSPSNSRPAVLACTTDLEPALLRSGLADADILVIRELRNLINDAHHRAKVAPRTADEAAKWLDWPQYLQVVHELRCSLAPPIIILLH